MERRERRSFNAEFKAEAVRLVREGGKSVPQVAKDLELTDSALRNWVNQAEVDEGRREHPPAQGAPPSSSWSGGGGKRTRRMALPKRAWRSRVGAWR